MQIVILVLVLALTASTTIFSRSMLAIKHAQHARIVKAQLDPLLSRSIIDAQTLINQTISAADTATGTGHLQSLPASVTANLDPCLVSDTANAQEADCNGVSITRKIAFTGYSELVGTPAASQPEMIGNVNVDSVGTLPVQRETTVEITLDRVANGVTDGHRSATAHFTTITSCANPTFDGFRDAAGSHENRGSEAQVNGKCSIASATCTTAGNDIGATVASDDSRIGSYAVCYDPGFIGNGGTHSGDLCNPTGNSAQGPQQTATYANKSLNNTATTTSGYSR